MGKLILIVIDGLGYHAKEKIGYLESLVENKLALGFKVKSELPSLSRPLYETLLTGVNPVNSGIINNIISRKSKEESIFSLAKKGKLITGAVAYHWIHELYNGEFIKGRDEEVNDEMKKNINNGRFYYEDEYPDSHLFAQANILLDKKKIDFLLLHTMNVDDVGHKYGGISKEYEDVVYKISTILSCYIPKWLENGYSIVITSDHGMSESGNHGGDSKEEREVPFWILDKNIVENELLKKIEQVQIATLCCNILGIKKSEKMKKLFDNMKKK
ncbi:MAG: alkaline phosphatase family protein [Fusobacteriaceae bacterium]